MVAFGPVGFPVVALRFRRDVPAGILEANGAKQKPTSAVVAGGPGLSVARGLGHDVALGDQGLAFLPGLAALRAGFAHEGAPLVGRPPDDQPAAVGAVSESVGLLLASALQVVRDYRGVQLPHKAGYRGSISIGSGR